MENGMIIQTSELTKVYERQTAVDHVSFEVKEGEIFGFLGPNGAGKSTTLLMLLGLSRPTDGTAHVCGIDPLRRPTDVKRVVGYLPENVGFYNDMDPVDSLRFISELNGMNGRGARDKIMEVLETVGLHDSLLKKIGNFSRGMKQRLGIAEVLLKDPKLLFLDEPTLGLDPDGAIRLIELVQSLNRDKNITVLVSSHNLHQVQKICHRVGIMIKGKMVAEGTIDALSKEKFGLGEDRYSLEEIYMKYFQEV
ncbi:MAG: ABC transporter ATP-binding protein [Desulfobacteraceae bacterium]|nr:MAG: ABC transporter ATP-binding protein [Desulfobacteraceae bacterium]